jgi:hypothetical protein
MEYRRSAKYAARPLFKAMCEQLNRAFETVLQPCQWFASKTLLQARREKAAAPRQDASRAN